MLATTGYLVNDLQITLPGKLAVQPLIKFEDVPTGLAALKAVPLVGWIQIIVFAGILETKLFKQDPK